MEGGCIKYRQDLPSWLCHRNQLDKQRALLSYPTAQYSLCVINHFKLAWRLESWLEYKYKLTLIGHEVCKVPNELPNHILFPLLVKN